MKSRFIVLFFGFCFMCSCGSSDGPRERMARINGESAEIGSNGHQNKSACRGRKSIVGSHNPLSKLRRFCDELEKNSSSYTIYEWADAADEYSRIEAELLKYNYDDAEHEEIGYLKGKCAGYLAKGVKEGEEKIEIQLEAAERGFDEVAGNLDW